MNTVSKPAASLAAANRLFHDGYCAAREALTHEGPILILLPRELVLHRSGTRCSFAYPRAFFDAAKAAAHVAVVLFALSHASEPDAETRSRIESLRKHLAHSVKGLNAGLQGGAHAELLPVLEASSKFADRLIGGPPAQEARAAFAREMGPKILRITEIATCEQIESLHDAVETSLRHLPASELRALQVVVVGDHQARSLSLGMQYFKRRLGEKHGSDGQVTYGENIDTEEDALALVGTRRLDKTIARAFFGDEKRLQRDVLGDAAAKCLETMNFAPIC
jgi:hypothetical protein